jgi:hypothetical protein
MGMRFMVASKNANSPVPSQATSADDPGAELDTTARFADVDWSTVKSWDDVLNVTNGEMLDSQVLLGDGSQFIKDKDMLVDKGPFVVLEYRVITDPETLRDYVNVLIYHKEYGKLRFNDGSTGIMTQLLEYGEKVKRDNLYTTQGNIPPMHCQNVRVSEYTVEQDDGSRSKAKTFYLV